MTKNERQPSAVSSWQMHVEELVAALVEVHEAPLPPNIAEVEQKLQPIGQPTEGISVAAVCSDLAGS